MPVRPGGADPRRAAGRGLLAPGFTSGTLLVTLVLLIFGIYPMVDPAGYGGILLAVGMILVLTSGCLAALDHPRLRWISVLLATASIAGQILRDVAPSRVADRVALVTAILMLFFTAGMILRNVLRAVRITTVQIQGAVSVYLLIGLGFGLVYALVAYGEPTAFNFGSGPMVPIEERLTSFVYFSFVTITTLGYGDVTPVARIARSLSTLEAVLGQFYLAVLIARLVSLEIVHRRTE